MTTAPGEAALHITLFGPMQVLVNGAPLPHLRSRKSLYILALLTLRHNKPVEREWLAGTLWLDVDQSQAFANLRQTLSALRDALGAEGKRIHAPNRRTLLLDLTGGAEADVVAFDTAVAGGELSALERAVSLYRGPLMEGCAEEWIVQDREAREQDCLKALKTLATAAHDAGDYDAAANHWRRAIALDPLWEAARRGLMQAFVGGGDSNAAVQAYREFAAALQEAEIRATPDEETTALYRRLREQARQRAAASAAPPPVRETAPPGVCGYLPHALTELIGREDEIQDIAERLLRARLVTLTGPGGIGKTRLAAAVAQETAREFPDGVFLVGLESLPHGVGADEANARPVLQQLAPVCGVKDGAGRPLLSVISEHLRRKRLLLVLDNCEHVLEPCASVILRLLRECPGLRVLATSREALHVSGEIVWIVPALAAPNLESLPAGGTALARVMAGYDAVRLFAERAEAVHKFFALTGENAREVALLCARLGGVPLALELAAARSGVLTPAQILSQWEARPLDALSSRLRDVAPRHRTLRATLEWSYDLLPPEAQAFLTDVGVFRGGWTLEAAQAVCPDADAVGMLTALRDASLINAAEGDHGVRYAMLETVRQFAAEMREQSGRAAAVGRRHAVYYAGWVKESYEGWVLKKGEAFHPFAARLEREYANCTVALTWALAAGEDEILVDFCHALIHFWQQSGRSDEGKRWMETIAGRLSPAEAQWDETAPEDSGEFPAPPLSPREEFSLKNQGWLLVEVGQMEKAAECWSRIFQRCLEAGKPTEGRTYYFNASTCLFFSDLPRSLGIMEECLPLERAVSGDNRANATILSQMALAARLTGQTERAAALLTEALDVCSVRDGSDPHSDVRAMGVAGQAALAEGDYGLAQERFESAAVLSRELADAYREASALCGMATLARETGNREREEYLLSAAVAAAGPAPPFRLTPMLRLQRAEFLLCRHDFAAAIALIQETLAGLRGRAGSFRSYTYPLLLQIADAEGAIGLERRHAGRITQLLGAAGAVAARLGLVAPERTERERAARLRTLLTERRGAERFAAETAAGAALEDEAALEFALTAE